MDNRVLVTGAAGFIGYHLCERLLKEGYEVYGIDNMDSYYSVNLKESRLKNLEVNKNFFFYKERFGDNSKIDGLLKDIKPSIIFHLAAQAGVRYSIENPRVYLRSNIEETFNLLEAIKNRGCSHFIFASTSSAYGASKVRPLNEKLPTSTPMSFYAATKISCEAIAHSYSNIFDIPTTALRFFTVYGPWGRPDMALIKFISAIDNDKKLELFNAGKMKRDFTYVDDIVDAVYGIKDFIPKSGQEISSFDSISPVAPYRTINIGNGEPRELTDFLRSIEDNMQKKAIIEKLPMQPGDVEMTMADTALIDSLIPKRKKTSMEDGVKSVVDWYKASGYKYF